MRSAIIILVCISFWGCSSSKSIPIEKGDVYSIEGGGKKLMSFSVPVGTWIMTPESHETAKSGWINLRGQPPQSPVGYAVKFSVKKSDVESTFSTQILEDMKKNNISAFADRLLPWANPKSLQEMKAVNYGQQLAYMNGYSCRDVFYQQKIAPQANDGNGIDVFLSNINCPLIINGELYSFVIDIRSSVKPEFYASQKEYNQRKKPEDIEVTFDVQDHLTNLGRKVLGIFNKIEFNGKVSQNYSDLIK